MTAPRRIVLLGTTTALSTVCVALSLGCGSDSTAQSVSGSANTADGSVTTGNDDSATATGTTGGTEAATSTSGSTVNTTGPGTTTGAPSPTTSGDTVSSSSVGGATSGLGGSTGNNSSGDSAGGTPAAGGTTTITTTVTGGGGTTDGSCTRDTLQNATNSLADALGAGDATMMALDPQATYVENAVASDFSRGVWQSSIQIAFQRDFLDVDTCETFSEIIVTQGVPLVLGVRLTLTGTNVSAVTALVTDADDWAFDAANYAAVSSAEDWSVIPEQERDTRETLIAAGDAYFNLFSDKSVVVPWNTPCTRLEGGQFTTGNTCDVGVPDGITFADKHWIVDRDLGTAIGMVRFGGANGLPDSHMFRCLQGKIRYVHTITVCDGGC